VAELKLHLINLLLFRKPVYRLSPSQEALYSTLFKLRVGRLVEHVNVRNISILFHYCGMSANLLRRWRVVYRATPVLDQVFYQHLLLQGFVDEGALLVALLTHPVLLLFILVMHLVLL